MVAGLTLAVFLVVVVGARVVVVLVVQISGFGVVHPSEISRIDGDETQ